MRLHAHNAHNSSPPHAQQFARLRDAPPPRAKFVFPCRATASDKRVNGARRRSATTMRRHAHNAHNSSPPQSSHDSATLLRHAAKFVLAIVLCCQGKVKCGFVLCMWLKSNKSASFSLQWAGKKVKCGFILCVGAKTSKKRVFSQKMGGKKEKCVFFSNNGREKRKTALFCFQRMETAVGIARLTVLRNICYCIFYIVALFNDYTN